RKSASRDYDKPTRRPPVELAVCGPVPRHPPARFLKRPKVPTIKPDRDPERPRNVLGVDSDHEHVIIDDDRRVADVSVCHGVAVMSRIRPLGSMPQTDVMFHVAPAGPVRGPVTENFVPPP